MINRTCEVHTRHDEVVIGTILRIERDILETETYSLDILIELDDGSVACAKFEPYSTMNKLIFTDKNPHAKDPYWCFRKWMG